MSWQDISIDANRSPAISSVGNNINVSIGDSPHADYYQVLRHGSAVTSFDIPSWLNDLIEENAVEQLRYRSNPLNQGGLAPKIVDPTTLGKSYELPPPWGNGFKKMLFQDQVG